MASRMNVPKTEEHYQYMGAKPTCRSVHSEGRKGTTQILCLINTDNRNLESHLGKGIDRSKSNSRLQLEVKDRDLPL